MDAASAAGLQRLLAQNEAAEHLLLPGPPAPTMLQQACIGCCVQHAAGVADNLRPLLTPPALLPPPPSALLVRAQAR